MTHIEESLIKTNDQFETWNGNVYKVVKISPSGKTLDATLISEKTLIGNSIGSSYKFIYYIASGQYIRKGTSNDHIDRFLN
jgi:hypothetical protein